MEENSKLIALLLTINVPILYITEVYSCFSIIGRDHSLVTAKVKVSFCMCKTPARKVHSSQHFAIMIFNKSLLWKLLTDWLN